jgi:hypothetical protein
MTDRDAASHMLRANSAEAAMSCRDWRLGGERLTAKRTGGLAKRNAGQC